ncbi:hypothetical protein B0H19DRAFT_1089436 [Mycena capillaripes]|nr:hypothetical protein B0H19DRAFT_1089436 [Mycena capillaripes]
MIVTENTPKSPAKASTPLLGDASGPSAPPAYAPGPSPIGSAQVPYTVYQPVYTQRREGEPAGKRFCKAFLVAIGVWILASALFGSIGVHNIGQFEYPIPRGVETEHCVSDWAEEMKNPTFPSLSFPYSASTSFDFSLPEKTLLLLSKGALSNGRLSIVSSDYTDKVSVKVTVKYHKAAVRDLAKVCLIARSNGEGGVGIFTPSPWRSRSYTDRLSFDVVLVLPSSHINALSTDVSNFSHDIDTLPRTDFGNLSLQASNGNIKAKLLSAGKATLTTSNAAVIVNSLIAPSASVKSSNGLISGSYTVCESLDLQTSNDPIKVTVTINGSGSGSKKNLSMRTSNGVLDALVNLGTSSGEAGTFNVKAQTSNAQLKTKIVYAPLDSVVTVDARTSNEEASVTLPSTYEGSFSLTTSNAPVSVRRVNPNEHDPACDSHQQSCKERTRIVEQKVVTKRSVSGNVHWDKKNANRGKVTLTTSNGPATILL